VIAGQFNTVSYYPFLWINLALTVSLANIVRRAGQRPASTGVLPLVPQLEERAAQNGTRKTRSVRKRIKRSGGWQSR
jgi:hypothetical protein